MPSERRIEFRVGINVGDIIIDGEDVYGDGINVAARVQAMAPPGGICTSKVVRDHVLDKLSFPFGDLGPQEVKNIARPVKVFRVDFGEAVLASSVAAPKSLRLAVAVLPFTATGCRPDDELFAEDLTRDLTSALGNEMRMTHVVSSGLTASYKGTSVNPRIAGRELDASYLVKGEIRRLDERIDVTVQLIEASSATQLWAKSPARNQGHCAAALTAS